MTVIELINILKKYDRDLIICVDTDQEQGGELNHVEICDEKLWLCK